MLNMGSQHIESIKGKQKEFLRKWPPKRTKRTYKSITKQINKKLNNDFDILETRMNILSMWRRNVIDV